MGSICNKSPNRIALVFGCLTAATGARATSTATGTFSVSSGGCDKFANAKIDVTFQLNAWKSYWAWTWLNAAAITIGVDRYEFDTTEGVVRFVFRPTMTPTFPSVSTLGSDQCCSCTQPRNCNVNSSLEEFSNTQMVMNMGIFGGEMDLVGALFVSQSAWFSTLWLVNKMEGAKKYTSIRYASVGAHYFSDGALTKGGMQAFIPHSTYKKIWPSLTGESMSGRLDIARSSTSTSTTVDPTITSKNLGAGDWGTQGLMFNITDLTYSIPAYDVTGLAEDLTNIIVGVIVGVGGLILPTIGLCWCCKCCEREGGMTTRDRTIELKGGIRNAIICSLRSSFEF